MMNSPGNPTSPMPHGAPPMPPGGGGYGQPSIHVTHQNQPGSLMGNTMQQPQMNTNNNMQQQQQQQPGMMQQQPGMTNPHYQQPGMMPNNNMNNNMANSGMMPPPQLPTLQNMNYPNAAPNNMNTLQQPGMMAPPQQPGMMNQNSMMNSGMIQPPPQQPGSSMNGSSMNGSSGMMQGNVMNRNAPVQPTAGTSNGGTAINNNNNNNNRGMMGSRLPRPAYQDPQTNIMYDCDQAEYEGYLTKQSMWLKDWRRRYFILKGNKLFFAKNEYQAPHGMIDLAHCTTVKSADWKSKKRHSFEISTPEITYLLYADTESEKDDWIGRVGKAIVRCSRTYVGQGGTHRQQTVPGGNSYMQQQQLGGEDSEDEDDIYENDDMENPYYND